MKLNYCSIFLITFLFMINNTAFSQGLLERATRRATQRMEQKAEDRINKKVDDAIDQQLDNIESSVERDTDSTDPAKKTGSASATEAREARSQRRMENLMGRIGISSEPLNLEDQYVFHSSLRMNIKYYDSNGDLDNEGDFITYLSNDNNYLAYEFVSGEFNRQMGENEKGIIIIDSKNEATIVLSDDQGKKTGIAYGLKAWNQLTGIEDDNEHDYAEDEDLNLTHPKFQKTGRTKTILGYRCEEWKFSDEEGEGVTWVTNEYQADSRHILSSALNQPSPVRGYPSGFMMETVFTDLETGERNEMKVTEIKDNTRISYNLDQYEITSLGSIGISEQQ